MLNTKIEITFFWNDDPKKTLHTRDAVIGTYDGESNDDDVFFWFDADGTELIGSHNDDFTVYGKTGLRHYEDQRSLYCYKNFAKETLQKLLDESQAKYIFISYSNEGIIPFEDMKEMLSKKGKYDVFETKHTNLYRQAK